MITLLNLETSGVLNEHHESTCKEYTSRKLVLDELPVYLYAEKFGKGSRFCFLIGIVPTISE